MTGRADPLGGGLDLTGFKPRKPEINKVPAEAIRKVAEDASFPSREAQPKEEGTTTPKPKAERRVYRTGRNAHFSCKVTQEVEEEIYSLTDELAKRTAEQVPGARWTVGMTVERMVAALKRELKT
jgi:hypothetical protein